MEDFTQGRPRIGRIYNNWTIIGLAETRTTKSGYRKTYWLCKSPTLGIKEVSQDSLTSGKSKGIGSGSNLFIDETGNIYGRLTIIKLGEKKEKEKGVFWKCRCECGNTVLVRGAHLRQGSVQSCGCLQKERGRENGIKSRISLEGKRFGKLVVISYAYTDEDRKAWWNCICDCGAEKVAQGNSLVRGSCQSCGCITDSIGELNIKKYLDEHQIKFQTQIKFKELKQLRFDFQINNFLLEFDGDQHYTTKISRRFSKQLLLDLEERDKIKNKYCLDNNIPLYRIPYAYKDNITEAFENLEQFRVKEIDHYQMAKKWEVVDEL